jgi:hypothetical protein
MTVRNIKKSLVAMEDIAQGKGEVSQTRAGSATTVHKVDVPYALDTTVEMSALDVTKYTRARVYSDTVSYLDYIYDADSEEGIVSDTGPGTWLLAENGSLTPTELISDTSIPYICTEVEYKALTVELPVSKTVHLTNRDADFTVISGTGTANGLGIIASNEVSQSITLNTDNSAKLSVISYGGKAEVGFDNTPASNAMLADLGYIEYPAGRLELHSSITARCKIKGAIGIATELACVGSNSGNYFIVFPESIRDVVVSGNSGAINGVNWSHNNDGSFAGWMTANNVIVKTFENIAANIGEVFALAWDNVRILQNGKVGSGAAVTIQPVDVGGDSGYFTTIYWNNVYLNQNNNVALNMFPSKKSPLLMWDNVVIEENCLLDGARQAYVSRADPFKIKSLYLEKGTVPALVLDNVVGSCDSVYLNNNTNEAIIVESTTCDFTFSNIKTTANGNNSITANGGSLHKLAFTNSNVKFTGGTLPNIARLELQSTTADSVYYPSYLGGTLLRLQVNDSSKLRAIRAYKLTGLNQTISAGGRVSLGQINLGSIMIDTTAIANLKSFQPDVTLRVTPATTGSQGYFNVFAYNSSGSPITLVSDECYVSFMRWDFT